MTGEDAERIVGVLGDHLARQKNIARDPARSTTGWAAVTALLVSVADLADWNVASDVAGLLGLEGEQQELIYRSWIKDRDKP